MTQITVDTTEEVPIPPSIVFKYLDAFLEGGTYKENIVLSLPLDIPVEDMPKEDWRLLLPTLRLLGFVDQRHIPTALLGRYFNSSSVERQRYWRTILQEIYGAELIEAMVQGNRESAKAHFLDLELSPRAQDRCLAFLGRAIEKAGLMRPQITPVPPPPPEKSPPTPIPAPKLLYSRTTVLNVGWGSVTVQRDRELTLIESRQLLELYELLLKWGQEKA